MIEPRAVLPPQHDMPAGHLNARRDHLIHEMLLLEQFRGGERKLPSRLRRPSTRLLALAAATFMITVLAVPSFGAMNALRDFFEGAPPTPEVTQHYLTWDELGARGSATPTEPPLPLADASQAHGVLAVTTSQDSLYLWLAPATGGSECWFIEIDNGQTTDHYRQIYGPNGCITPSHDTEQIRWFEFPNRSLPGLRLVFGRVAPAASEVHITLNDGATTDAPVVEHYFLSLIAPDETAKEISAVDSAGQQVAHSTQGDVTPEALGQ